MQETLDQGKDLDNDALKDYKELASIEYENSREKANQQLNKKLAKIENGQKEPKEILNENLEILGEYSIKAGKKIKAVATVKGKEAGVCLQKKSKQGADFVFDRLGYVPKVTTQSLLCISLPPQPQNKYMQLYRV